MVRRIKKFIRGEDANAAIEAGFLFPVMVAILCGMIDMGVALVTAGHFEIVAILGAAPLLGLKPFGWGELLRHRWVAVGLALMVAGFGTRPHAPAVGAPAAAMKPSQRHNAPLRVTSR